MQICLCSFMACVCTLCISLALEVNCTRHKFHRENEKKKKAVFFKLSSAVLAACKRDQTCSVLMVLHSEGTELSGSALLSAAWTFESVFFSCFSQRTVPHNPRFSVWTHTCACRCLCLCCSACLHLLHQCFGGGFFSYRNRKLWLLGKIKKTRCTVLPSGLITRCIKWEVFK